MESKPLAGKKIAVLVETEYIPEEIEAYRKRFPELGAEVHFMSRLWGQESQTFVSDVDQVGKCLQYLNVNIDFEKVNLDDYAAVIMAANYTSVRLRYFQPPEGHSISPEQSRTAPAVQFFAKAMGNPRLVKGLLCHGLWLLTPMPELLKGRRVICHEVVLADIVNAGAVYVPSPSNIVVDGDLVTGHSGSDVQAFIDAITELIVQKSLETCGELQIALLKAVEANDLASATELIQRGVDVSKRGPQPYTPLMIAAGRGYVQMTEKLLQAGADVQAIDSSLGASALHKAAQGGVVDVARLLLQHGAFINLQSAVIGNTPLIDAVWSKQPAMVKFLLDQGAIINIKSHIDCTVWDFIGKEPNWTAGNTIPEDENWGRLIREMLEARQRDDKEAIERQQLMKAVQNQDLHKVKYLIAEGADVNEKSPLVGEGNDGQTPLLVACFNGYTDIARELLKAGANPRIVDYLLKATPCHKAAFSGHPEAVKLLLEDGRVEVEAQGPYNGYTALHDAVWHGSTETVKVLLNANVALNLRGQDNKTPLELAIANGYNEIAALIKEKMQTAK